MSRIDLTARQFQVVSLVAKGLENREIGAQLGLSSGTVRNVLSAVYDRVGVSSRAYLATLLLTGQFVGQGASGAARAHPHPDGHGGDGQALAGVEGVPLRRNGRGAPRGHALESIILKPSKKSANSRAAAPRGTGRRS